MDKQPDVSHGSSSLPGNDQVKARLRVGVSFRKLSCHGIVTSARWQSTVGSFILAIPTFFASALSARRLRKVQILHDFEGLIRPGELLLVLGRPGSGCSTFLKALAGETRGFDISNEADMTYHCDGAGVAHQLMQKHFKGERVYLAELDVHLAELTTGQTLDFAAATRENQHDGGDLARGIAEQFGLTDALNTKVGNAMIRGISGGEKRRTSLAEVFVGDAPFQCWDNSTRGLDSLTSLTIVKLLRESTQSTQSTVAMSLYQSSQDMYNLFDKVMLLYEGRQIYFGPANKAVDYFTSLGFLKPGSATTADFLTSLTNPEERVIREGHQEKVPRLPDEFAAIWKQSPQAEALRADILEMQSAALDIQNDGFRAKQSGLRTSTYPLSWTKEVAICIQRAVQRIRNEKAPTIGSIIANGILGLVVGSAYYGLTDTTADLDQRAVVIFFALVVNSFAPAYEITIMWASRPVVQKHHQYAFYHPFAEAAASMITEFPTKLAMSFCLHVPIYFLANLRQTASAFFIHWLFMLVNLMTMSMVFRTIGSVSRALEQSIPPSSILSILCVTYTGFVLPPDYMKPWLAWFWRINPVAYTYESLMVNEFRHRPFPCAAIIPAGPAYSQVDSGERICGTIGGVAGEQIVQGSSYIFLKYGYVEAHLWRNIGILFGIMIPFCGLYLLASEYIPTRASRGEILLFKRGTSAQNRLIHQDDCETGDAAPHATHEFSNSTATCDQTIRARLSDEPASSSGATFCWESVNYEIKTSTGSRCILTDINGWVKAGTLNALMGITGAGKTALLDTLADRITTGIVSGDIFVNGQPRDSSFCRRMGYMQQEDIHLDTATVREALEFSALLRQPQATSTKDKLAYVDYVLDVMEMKSYAEAIVGVPGEGLNVEQRKRLTIAVEMAAKPDLLLFLDEPTSGLDSQTAWSICRLLRKLADGGQSILCTIHQPSAQLFGMFDRLLLLNKGGTTLYFGDIGKGASVVTEYFQSHGAPKCQSHENPAEWMLQVTGNILSSSGSQQMSAKRQWSQVWDSSPEKQAVLQELARLRSPSSAAGAPADRWYTASLVRQILMVSQRIFTEHWRDPVYTYSKVALCISVALLNGISFYNTNHDIQGLISLIFSSFLTTQLFSSINQLIIPRFIAGRQLFEARERFSQSYVWPVFVTANLVVELAWQTAISVPVFASWYFPLGLYRQATAEHGFITFLMIWLFNMWANTLSQLFAVAIEHGETVVQAATLCFWLSLVFCGVLVPPDALPRFWIFMYRVSPLTYLIEGLAASALANLRITCSGVETRLIPMPDGLPTRTCGEYLQAYIQVAGGYVDNSGDTSDCRYCPLDNTSAVLERYGMDTQHPWRDVGFLAAYTCFNVVAMFGVYWLARVPRKTSTSKESK